MMYKPGTGVTKVGLRLPGMIVNTAPANKYVQEPWYMIEWVDGNTSEEPHSNLKLILPPNTPRIVILA